MVCVIGVLNSEVRKNKEGFTVKMRVVYENENGNSGMRVENNTAMSLCMRVQRSNL